LSPAPLATAPPSFCFLASQCYAAPPDILPFPTRRSSDLADPRGPAVRRNLRVQVVRQQDDEPVHGQHAHAAGRDHRGPGAHGALDRKSTRLNSSLVKTSYAVFCLKKKRTTVIG